MTTERRRICFVTGTRAEFGLMTGVLEAIRAHPGLQLQIVVTGMHLDAAHGRSIDRIRRDGWKVDAVVGWPAGGDRAASTGRAMAGLAKAFARLKPDVVLVVGDRVEAFAAAAAAHLAGRIVAHVHGGDRALGQIDDSLRHAITKLSHIHFPATRQSARRLQRLGEDARRIHMMGSPGVAGIVATASTPQRLYRHFAPLRACRFALVLLHPTSAAAATEFARANLLLDCVQQTGFDHILVGYPNNDPGSAGIIRAYKRRPPCARLTFVKDLLRPDFLGLLRDAAVLVGNSSSGIIEAGSFGTPVIDVGDRQLGRQRGRNVVNVPFAKPALKKALVRAFEAAGHRRHPHNIYGRPDSAARIAHLLATVPLQRLRPKLITF